MSNGQWLSGVQRHLGVSPQHSRDAQLLNSGQQYVWLVLQHSFQALDCRVYIQDGARLESEKSFIGQSGKSFVNYCHD